MTVKYEHLVGRRFTGIGEQDCFKLFQDFYADNFGIQIRSYARPHDWSSDDINLIELTYEREGFEKITQWKPKDLRPGDVLCVCIGESNPNHFAIYVGDSQIVHHLFGKMSSVEPLRDFWFNQTAFLLRHPDVPDLRPVYPDVNFMDLLRARNATPTE